MICKWVGSWTYMKKAINHEVVFFKIVIKENHEVRDSLYAYDVKDTQDYELRSANAISQRG